MKACKALKRHISALESDSALVEEVLRPLIPCTIEVEPTVASLDQGPSSKRLLEVDDDEVEVKSTPKRTYT